MTNYNVSILGSKAIFESATRPLVKPIPNIPQELKYNEDKEKFQYSLFSLESKNLTIIPTPSILLHISKLNLSNNKITSMKFLANLINLNEIDISNNCITNISGINELRNLRYLKLQNNCIK